jgi:hypothetical protein
MRKTLTILLATAAVAFTAYPGLTQQAARPVRDPNATPAIPGQNMNGMRVYIRSGLKSHGAGSHDYPQFLSDWSKVLTEHGAVVDGSFHAPSAQELANTDVVVFFKGDAGYMTPSERRPSMRM